MSMDAAQLVLLYDAAATNMYWTSSALSILAYDYLLTFPREVRFVWNRKFSPATALFLLNRYVILLLYFVDIITLLPIIPCEGVGKFIVVLEIMPYIIWAVFSGLRTYALSGRNALIGLFVSLLSLVPAGVNAYFLSTYTFVDLTAPTNCTAFSDITSDLSKTLTIVSRTSLMAADLFAIAVTWWSTYGIRKLSRHAQLGTSFGTLLLRDGTIYFFVLLAMNVVHMTLNTVKPNNVVQQASYVTILENPITSILISRFILNLREVDQRGLARDDASCGFDDSHPSFVASSREREETLRFAASSRSFADEFSAPLDFGFAREDVDSEVADGSGESMGWADRGDTGVKETVVTSLTSSTMA